MKTKLNSASKPKSPKDYNIKVEIPSLLEKVTYVKKNNSGIRSKSEDINDEYIKTLNIPSLKTHNDFILFLYEIGIINLMREKPELKSDTDVAKILSVFTRLNYKQLTRAMSDLESDKTRPIEIPEGKKKRTETLNKNRVKPESEDRINQVYAALNIKRIPKERIVKKLSNN